ncbi:MAG TPA: hypothetical protein VJN89_14810 [Candidatus Acidoferrum sp.]|nr:hypothetical protein [Candidatus Acidoferrum sp.]
MSLAKGWGVGVSGALWAVVYNLIWGAAWFAFMRREWRDAMAAIGRPIPFTQETWLLWVALTIPIGLVIMTYATGRAGSPTKAAVTAAVALWVLMTLGLAAWASRESLSLRIIALDSAVNLFSTIAASLAGGWSQRQQGASAFLP